VIRALLYRAAFSVARYLVVESARREPATHRAPARRGPPDPDDLGAIIARQKARLRQLERYIDDRFPDLEPDQYKGLVALQSQMAGRISRMERDRAKLQAEAPDRADDDVGEALEIVSQVLGIDLTGQP